MVLIKIRQFRSPELFEIFRCLLELGLVDAFDKWFLLQENRLLDFFAIIGPEHRGQVAANRPAPLRNVLFIHVFVKFLLKEIFQELQRRSMVKHL
ncbi:hypothetical protein D3C86_1818590 [compost metagenome]